MTKLHQFNCSVIDLETSVDCPIGSNKASPHWPSNDIVLAGSIAKGRCLIEPGSVFIRSYEGALTPASTMFVGVNIPFDMQHMYKKVKFIYDNRHHYRVWDCQVAEYLLTRQQHKYPSLDEMSLKYGGTVKNDEIKKHWEAGGRTEDIDPEKLKVYLKADLENTELIYKKQVREAIERGMLPLIMAQMEAVAAVTEMQYNGIKVDKHVLEAGTKNLVAKIEIAAVNLRYRALSTDIPSAMINIDSPKALSLLLFGGTVKVPVKRLDGMYKNGNPKFKTGEEERAYKGFGLPTEGIEKTIHGWSTNDKTLKKLSKLHSFLDELHIYRELRKDFSTYFEPLAHLIFPDGCIHQNLNVTSTNTGRLSCTEPNLQNVSDKHKSEIKKVYVSRWGKSGRIVEVDYRQLEIIALAELSRDPQLVADCNAGVDIHTELFRNMYGRVPNDWERKQFKRLSFALIYGSGIKNMAQQAMVTEEVARNFKKTFEKRYPMVPVFRNIVRGELHINRVPNAFHDHETGKPIGTSHYTLPTGRELYYREWVQSYGPRDVDFSYTEICNYPVQAFATGDIVPIMLGKLYRKLLTLEYRDKVLLINTVHDSIMLDIHEDVINNVVPIIKETLESVPQVMQQVFGMEMVTNPKVSISAGLNWFDQTEMESK